MPFLRRIFSSKILPTWTIFLFDACVVAASVIFAYFIRFPATIFEALGSTMWLTVVVVTFFNLVFFRLFRTYANVLRLSSFVDVMHIFVATTLGYFVSIIVALLWPVVFGEQLTFIPVLLIAEFFVWIIFVKKKVKLGLTVSSVRFGTSPERKFFSELVTPLPITSRCSEVQPSNTL